MGETVGMTREVKILQEKEHRLMKEAHAQNIENQHQVEKFSMTEGKLQDEIEKLHLRYQAKLDYLIVAKNDVEDTLVDLRGKLKLSRQEHRQQIQESRFGLKDKTNINQNLQEEIDFLS